MFDIALNAVGTKGVHVRVLLTNYLLFPRPVWFHGVVESIQDSESCDPSSNLGGTFDLTFSRVHCLFSLYWPRFRHFNDTTRIS